jgi:hypothetical protein
MAFKICASRAETSYASSVGVVSALLTGGEESDRACDLFAFPAFLNRAEEDVKVRARVRVRCCLGTAWRTLGTGQLLGYLQIATSRTILSVATQLLEIAMIAR